MARRGGNPLKVLRLDGRRLEVVQRPTPEPVADQVLVEVAGAGVNRADLVQRAGRYPAPPGVPADVPGLEFSGTVAAAGPLVERWRRGDRVFGILGGGGHASHVLTREALCARVPAGLDLVDAGAVPEVFVTAHDALLVQAGLRPGERVLVHGAGSGVGTAAVQLVRAVGATSVGTSRSPDKLERAKSLGLHEAVVAGGDMAERIGEVDVVLDLVGGDYLVTDVDVCLPGGRIIVLSTLAGTAARLDVDKLMRKRLTVVGSILRPRPDHAKAIALEAFAREVLPLFDGERLRPVVDRVFPLDQAEQAYDLVAANTTFGKVVLAPER